jgi:hypothetical protein
VTDNLGSTIGLVDRAGNVDRTYAYDHSFTEETCSYGAGKSLYQTYQTGK